MACQLMAPAQYSNTVSTNLLAFGCEMTLDLRQYYLAFLSLF